MNIRRVTLFALLLSLANLELSRQQSSSCDNKFQNCGNSNLIYLWALFLLPCLVLSVPAIVLVCLAICLRKRVKPQRDKRRESAFFANRLKKLTKNTARTEVAPFSEYNPYASDYLTRNPGGYYLQRTYNYGEDMDYISPVNIYQTSKESNEQQPPTYSQVVV